jgi:hypothetical protein
MAISLTAMLDLVKISSYEVYPNPFSKGEGAIISFDFVDIFLLLILPPP